MYVARVYNFIIHTVTMQLQCTLCYYVARVYTHCQQLCSYSVHCVTMQLRRMYTVSLCSQSVHCVTMQLRRMHTVSLCSQSVHYVTMQLQCTLCHYVARVYTHCHYVATVYIVSLCSQSVAKPYHYVANYYSVIQLQCHTVFISELFEVTISLQNSQIFLK